MENIVSKIVWGIVVIVAMCCMVKCAYAPSQPSSDDKKIHGYYYDVIQLNDSTYLLNPTYNSTRSTEPKIVSKDSLGFYISAKSK